MKSPTLKRTPPKRVSASMRYDSTRLDRHEQHGVNCVKACVDAIQRIDFELERYGVLLDEVAPRANKRITLRFLCNRGARPNLRTERHPVFVAWHRQHESQDLMYYDEVSIQTVLNSVPQYGVFENVRDEMKEIIRAIQKLLVVRKNLLRTVLDMTQVAGTRLSDAENKLDQARSDFAAMTPRMMAHKVANLKEWKGKRDALDVAHELAKRGAVG
jgi:hypothetical protein